MHSTSFNGEVFKDLNLHALERTVPKTMKGTTPVRQATSPKHAYQSLTSLNVLTVVKLLAQRCIHVP
jgi:hypothetical protein